MFSQLSPSVANDRRRRESECNSHKLSNRLDLSHCDVNRRKCARASSMSQRKSRIRFSRCNRARQQWLKLFKMRRRRFIFFTQTPTTSKMMMMESDSVLVDNIYSRFWWKSESPRRRTIKFCWVPSSKLNIFNNYRNFPFLRINKPKTQTRNRFRFMAFSSASLMLASHPSQYAQYPYSAHKCKLRRCQFDLLSVELPLFILSQLYHKPIINISTFSTLRAERERKKRSCKKQ